MKRSRADSQKHPRIRANRKQRVAHLRPGSTACRRAGVANPGADAQPTLGRLPAGVPQHRTFRLQGRLCRRHGHAAEGAARPAAVAPEPRFAAAVAARTPAVHLHARLPAIPIRLLQGPPRRRPAGAAGHLRLEPGRYAPAHPLRVQPAGAGLPRGRRRRRRMPGSASGGRPSTSRRSPSGSSPNTTKFSRKWKPASRACPKGEPRRLYTQRLFNRLMFLYFIQRKGWLSFQGDTRTTCAPCSTRQSPPRKISSTNGSTGLSSTA